MRWLKGRHTVLRKLVNLFSHFSRQAIAAMDDNGVDARMDGGNDQPLPVQPAEAPTSYIGNTETDNFTDTSWNRAGTDIPTEVSITVLSAPDSMESQGAIATPQPAPVPRRVRAEPDF